MSINLLRLSRARPATARFDRLGFTTLKSTLGSFSASSTARTFTTSQDVQNNSSNSLKIEYKPTFTGIDFNNPRFAQLNKNSKIAILSMTNPPANTFDAPQLEALKQKLKELEEDKDVRGLILTSSTPGFFSAGFELTSFVKGKDHIKENFRRLTEITRMLYTSRLITVAAIDGHALALGAILTLACTHRYMLDGDYKYGLNEVQIGLPLPIWACELLAQTCSLRNVEKLVSDGVIINSREAHGYGIIDKTFEDKEQLMEGCIKTISKRALLPEFAQSTTVLNSRAKFVERFDQVSKSEVEHFVDNVMRDEVQLKLKQAFAALKSKKK